MVDNILLWCVLLNAIFSLYWLTLIDTHTLMSAILFKLVPCIFGLGALMYALNEFGII